MQTFTGRFFDVATPDSRNICIEDVAHALSNICRYCGHTKEFYSVAQHSFLASQYCDEFPVEALLHDAAEAYVGDITRPIKAAVPEVRNLEHLWHVAVSEAFGIRYPYPKEVEFIDHVMLASEMYDVMGGPSVDAPTWLGTDRNYPRILGKIVPLPPKEAEVLFLARYYALMEDRTNGIAMGIRDYEDRFSPISR